MCDSSDSPVAKKSKKERRKWRRTGLVAKYRQERSLRRRQLQCAEQSCSSNQNQVLPGDFSVAAEDSSNQASSVSRDSDVRDAEQEGDPDLTLPQESFAEDESFSIGVENECEEDIDSESNERETEKSQEEYDSESDFDTNFNSIDWDTKVSPTGVTKGEIFMLVLSHYIRYSSSDTELQNILDMINCMFGHEVIVRSVYLFKKLFEKPLNSISYHFYCEYCFSYVKCVSKVESHSNEVCKCTGCDKDVVINLKYNNYFVMFDIESQIKNIFMLNNLPEIIKNADLTNRDGLISDITDGKLYQDLLSSGDLFATYNFNIDGASVFNGSKQSITPIQLLLNELPPDLRGKNIIMAGLWFGEGEPKMELFLQPFVKQAAHLSTCGVDFQIGEETFNIKMKPLCCTVDSVARALIINMKQFNGFDSCPWCYHPGFGGFGSVKFPNLKTYIRDRTDQEVLESMEKAQRSGNIVDGVKGSSALILLPDFPIVRSFAVDYLHGVVLGDVKAITDRWMTDCSAPYYLGTPPKKRFMKNVFDNITIPNEIHRLPKPLDERRQWKGSEWRNWLLVYSLPCIQKLLPTLYLKHWALLVTAITILLGKYISEEDLDNCQKMLEEFVADTEELYGIEQMTYNNHLLVHLVSTVRLLGPLWANSTYPFASDMLPAKNMVHGGNGIALQISNKIAICSYFPYLAMNIKMNTMIEDKVCSILSKKIPSKKEYFFTSQNQDVEMNLSEMQLLENENYEYALIQLCKSLKFSRKYYQPYYVNSKFSNCLITLRDGSHGIIEKIFFYENSNSLQNFKFIVKKIRSSQIVIGITIPHMFKLDAITQQLQVVSCTDVLFKCALIKVAGEEYIMENSPCYEVQ